MSEVFLASTPVGETVVVKVLSDRHARDPVYQELLRKPGRAAAGLILSDVAKDKGSGGANGD